MQIKLDPILRVYDLCALNNIREKNSSPGWNKRQKNMALNLEYKWRRQLRRLQVYQ